MLPLDFHDDPNPMMKLAGDKLPDFVKSHVPDGDRRSRNKDCFAINVYTKTAGRIGYFPTDSRPETWMSAWYLGHNAHRLPEEVVKTAAFFIEKAAAGYEMELPEDFPHFVGEAPGDNVFDEAEFQKYVHASPNQFGDMAKWEGNIRQAAEDPNDPFNMLEGAEVEEKTAEAVKVCGTCSAADHATFQHAAVVKIASVPPEEMDDIWFGVVTPEGRRLYPMYTPDFFKRAEAWFNEHGRELDPVYRWGFATKLASAAYDFDTAISRQSLAWDYLATGYSSEDYLLNSIGMRKMACPDAEVPLNETETKITVKGQEKIATATTVISYSKALDRLVSRRDTLDPLKFAELLTALDKVAGAASSWDNIFPDPYATVFHMDKVADYHWSSRDEECEVSGEQLKGWGSSREETAKKLRGHINKDTIEAFVDAPITVFNALPNPEKELICQVLKGKSLESESEEAL